MKEFNLLEGIERAENSFYDTYLRSLHDKLKAGRRALILLLMIRNPLSDSENEGLLFTVVEQAFIELSAAIFANGRSAFLLIMKGYIYPAQCLLRTLWEQVVFMEYFRLYPDECLKWAKANVNDRAARTQRPDKAWGAIKAKGKASVLGGKRGKVYEFLTGYTHSRRNALFDLTVQINDSQAATSFGPAYKPKNLEFVLDYLVSDLVSAITIIEMVFHKRLRDQGSQSLHDLLIEILILAGLIGTSSDDESI